MEEDDVTSKAFAAIQAQLAQFTSPLMNAASSSLPLEEDEPEEPKDAMDWLAHELQEQPLPMETPVRKQRTSLLERAETPVMSNTKASPEDDSDVVMQPVQTPFKVITTDSVPSPTTLVTNNSEYNIYRRHHDALLVYVKAKRSLDHRMDLEKQDFALTTTATATSPNNPSSSLASQETKVELQFLNSVANIFQNEEKYCWNLLATLRKLGLSALIWNNDFISSTQNASAQTFYLQQLSNETQKSPFQIMASLSSQDAPLVLQRKFTLLKWMQSCLNHKETPPPPPPAKPVTSQTFAIPDLDTPSLISENSDRRLLQSCLSLILAGRLEDAQQLARSHHQHWRAAAWSGGRPHGYTSIRNEKTQSLESKSTGNPNRALWKRKMWNAGRSSKQKEEAAICHLLANDSQACLANSILMEDWLTSLYSIYNCVWGRLEDELLHWHNNHRRKLSPAFPGTNLEKNETEQLLATSGLSKMSEKQIIQLLAPVEKRNVWQACMSAFLIGKSAVLELPTLSQIQEVEELRFLTHISLYLDSLQVGITPLFLEGIADLKNQFLMEYVQYLASRPQLWQFLCVYVSLLPETQILEYFPTILCQVLVEDRPSMLEQIRQLLPHLELRLLRETYHCAMKQSSEERKCQAIGWLLSDKQHFGDALVCANSLLRKFFLADQDSKMETAMTFVEEYLPEELLSSVDGEPAASEHLAFLDFLDAYRSFGKWKDLISTDNETRAKTLDMTNLNSTEASIAQKHLSKEVIRQKREACQVVVEAAEQARLSLNTVLTHPGGWLSMEDSSGDIQHKKELEEIRSRYLVLAVQWYHAVCEETASWLSRTWNNDSICLEEDKLQQELRATFWYRHALDLANLVANAEHNIYKAFDPTQLQDFLAKLAEIAISQLMNTSGSSLA